MDGRKCHSKECEFLATHYLEWTDGGVYYCLFCAQKTLTVAAAIGYDLPRRTLRPMTIDEMMPDEIEVTKE